MEVRRLWRKKYRR